MSNAYIFLGPPGAGKGTLGEIFCQRTGVIHISTGQLLRDEMAAGTELGNQVKSLIASGALVGDEIVTAMVASRLAKADAQEKGVLLDGYPRTVAQAESLKQILADTGIAMGAAVMVDAPREILMKRLTGRRMCTNKECGAIYNIYNVAPAKEGICDRCGAELYQRSDDTEATVLGRLKVYDEQTAPVIGFYEAEKSLVVVEDADTTIEENYKRLLGALKLD
ncbi:MAG: adenylate kinase [Victivallales bacterium]|nr:adenylate kinase [Victivallales bacterium]